MATLALSNAETLANVGMMLGVGRTPSQWDPEVTADVNRIVRSGRRKFFTSHQWQFLQQNFNITTEAPLVVTGAFVAGVLTLGGGLPSDPVGNYKVVPGTTGGIYDIAAGTPGTSITLDDTTVNTAAATTETITLYRYRFPLPSNFANFVGPVVVENWQFLNQLQEYHTIPQFEALALHNGSQVVTGPPQIFSVNSNTVNNGTDNNESGTFNYYFFAYPLIDKVYILKTFINIQPGDALALSTDTANPLFAECLQEAILSSAEVMYLRNPGVHTAMFNQLLPLAIKRDQQLDGVRRMLPRRRRGHHYDNSQIRTANIDISGALV
jgi:hypothetical protein